MRLEHLFEIFIDIKPILSVGMTTAGERVVADLTGGHFEGEKLNGTVRASGADWALICNDGTLKIDVRAVLETNDGAVIYMPYRGRMVVNDTISNILEKGEGETQYGDTYWITQIQFETGDERYAWLNSLMAIGEGRLAPHKAMYKVSAIHKD